MYNAYQSMNGFPNFQQNMPMYNQQPMLQRQEVAKVNGENGARAYQIAPNSSVLLLDEVNPIVYLKTSDSGGYASITPYSITPYQSEPTVDVKSLEERIERLEGLINESNTTSVKRSNKQAE